MCAFENFVTKPQCELRDFVTKYPRESRAYDLSATRQLFQFSFLFRWLKKCQNDAVEMRYFKYRECNTVCDLYYN